MPVAWLMRSTVVQPPGPARVVLTSPRTERCAMRTSPFATPAGFVSARLDCVPDPPVNVAALERIAGSAPELSRYRSVVAVPALSDCPALNWSLVNWQVQL